MKQILLTGIKPTGTPHIGNYFGAIKPAIDLSKTDQYYCNYFIADYHALTTIKSREDLINNFREVACTWLACGLDPEKVTFYRQSDIRETFELSCILSNVTPKGLMNRAHAYKAITENNIEQNIDIDSNVNMGLYNYPILMAADILLFNTNIVPVGLDQKQHIEIARDIANYFNKKYGKNLVVPRELIQENVAVIPGLDGRKMSKSYNNIIPLFCSEQELKKIISSIKTDSSLPDEPKSLDSTIYNLFKLFSNKEELDIITEKFNTGISWSEAKSILFTIMNNYLTPMREKYNYYINHFEEVEDMLKKGAEKARKISTETIERIRKAIGAGI